MQTAGLMGNTEGTSHKEPRKEQIERQHVTTLQTDHSEWRYEPTVQEDKEQATKLTVNAGPYEKEPESAVHLKREVKDREFEALRHLILTGVKLNMGDDVRPVGHGAFGTVYKAEYNGTPCAAKQVNVDLLIQMRTGKQDFIQECLLHGWLNHKNIVKMLGVYTYDESAWPVLVMELMEYPLAKLTMNDEELFIPMYVKLSILQDISAGLGYLHTMNPPILHCDLSPHNILLTADLVAKLGDFRGAAKAAKGVFLLDDQGTEMSWDYHNSDDTKWQFDHHESSYYVPSAEVFFFGCIACHVITQKWLKNRTACVLEEELLAYTHYSRFFTSPIIVKEGYHRDDYGFHGANSYGFRSSLSRCQDFIHQISEGPVKQLIESCLIRRQNKRPPITAVYESITDIVTSK